MSGKRTFDLKHGGMKIIGIWRNKKYSHTVVFVLLILFASCDNGKIVEKNRSVEGFYDIVINHNRQFGGVGYNVHGNQKCVLGLYLKQGGEYDVYSVFNSGPQIDMATDFIFPKNWALKGDTLRITRDTLYTLLYIDQIHSFSNQDMTLVLRENELMSEQFLNDPE